MFAIAFNWIAGSALGRTVAAVGAFVLIVSGALLLGRRQGARKQKERAHAKDRLHADRIRRAVERSRAERVRPSDIIYRD